MKFRIKKEDGFYIAEYWCIWLLSWFFVSDSVSKDIEKTREACMKFKQKEDPDIVETFKL